MRKNFRRTLASLLVIVMLICAVPLGGLTVGAVTNIPSDAVEFNGHYYKMFENTGKSWTIAKEYCESLGGHLAVITDAEEQSFVETLIFGGQSYSYWIGAYYDYDTTSWKWITDEEWGFTRWSSGEPSLNGEDKCSIYKNTTGTSIRNFWNDVADLGPWYNSSRMGIICEWESNKKVPNGYDFYKDSYSFGNYGASLSKKYFSGLFNSANMEEIYKSQKKTDGICCGFAYTTAAIYNGIPSATSIFNKPLIGSPTYLNSLRDAKKSSKVNIGDKTISVSDYIKYAYVYQFSEDVFQQRMNTSFTSTPIQGLEFLYNAEGISNLYNLVASVTSDNYLGVIIWLNGLDVAGSVNPGCHTVLCVGVDKNGILIDDSNLREDHGFKDELSHLTINDDGTWVYEPYNGEYNSRNTSISYAMDCHKPYSILSTGNKVIAHDDSYIEEGDSGNNYIVGCEKIDAGKGILYCDATNYQLNDIEKTEFLDIGSGTNRAEQTAKLYWVNDDETITITNIEDTDNNSEFHFSSGDTIAEANVTNSSSITFNADNSINISSVINDIYTVSYSYCFETDNYEDKVVKVDISGTASDKEITAAQTETGIVVTGLSDGTVTLTKDDEVIGTQEIKDAVSDIEITYDKDGTTDDMDVVYETDKSTSHCNCLCHKTGFLGFIYKIVRIFWKIFKINKTCACGAQHY